jgi:hypothetical protein
MVGNPQQHHHPNPTYKQLKTHYSSFLKPHQESSKSSKSSLGGEPIDPSGGIGLGSEAEERETEPGIGFGLTSEEDEEMDQDRQGKQSERQQMEEEDSLESRKNNSNMIRMEVQELIKQEKEEKRERELEGGGQYHYPDSNALMVVQQATLSVPPDETTDESENFF